jgi:hypothetical protein
MDKETTTNEVDKLEWLSMDDDGNDLMSTSLEEASDPSPRPDRRALRAKLEDLEYNSTEDVSLYLISLDRIYFSHKCASILLIFYISIGACVYLYA